MRNIFYILKRIIIGIGIVIGVMYIKHYVSFAATVDGTITWGVDQQSVVSISTGDYKYVPASNSRMFWLTGLGEEDAPTTYYFNLLLCVNTSSTNITGAAWSDNSLPNSSSITVKNTGINITNVPCKFVGAYPGKVVQVTSATQAYNGDISLAFKVSINQDVSYQIINYSIANEPYTLIESQQDYTDLLNSMMTTITNTWQTQINKLQDIWNVDQATLAEAQIQTGWQKRMAEAAEAFNRVATSDDIEENNSQFSEFDDYLAQNGVITNLVSMPVTLFTKVLSTLNGSCTTYNLGSLYGTDLNLPCIVISDYLGTSLWGIIDIIISGLLVYAISRHFVKMFNKMSSLEESDIID